jgi:CelD/BcsL family acetyltransferase involved in cellulose biosynthesis
MRPVAVHALDPLQDPRWADLVARHPAASVFHTPAWLAALQRSYGYHPIAYTTSPPGAALGNGLVFSRVESWLTGRRLVSLPFSDHCAPLVEEPAELAALCETLRGEARSQGWRYVEIRSKATGDEDAGDTAGLTRSKLFWLHMLDLRPSLDDLFRGADRDSVQRRVSRAERAGLTYECGRSETLVRKLYGLLVLTRRRHRLPPQPLHWFRNLAASLGDALTIRVLSHAGRPVAGMLTLRFGRTVVYKYGGSDARFHHLGGMPLLMWRTIQDAKSAGALALDLGRTDRDDAGLITFKERLGAVRTPLAYLRWPPSSAERRRPGLGRRLAGQVLTHLPDALLRATGERLYRHVG